MNIIDMIIAIVVGVLIVICFEQHIRINFLDSDVATYQQQIDMLQTESAKQQKAADEAYSTAQNQMRQIQENNKKILLSKVPKDCQGSIKWIIQQAQSL
jgi:outer membrane murein-binding lipoprotein Lpp